MEWIAEYWYILPLGLIVTIFLLGYRVKGSKEENAHVHKHGAHADGKTHKSGHGCCH